MNGFGTPTVADDLLVPDDWTEQQARSATTASVRFLDAVASTVRGSMEV